MISNLPDDADDEKKKTAPETLEELEEEKEEDDETKEDPEETEETEESSGKSVEPEKPEEPETSGQGQYYLQVVKTGEAPEWPRPKEDLDVFSQPLEGGLIQYYAYPKDSGKTGDDLPHAEQIAAKNKSDDAVIIIDQVSDHLNPGSCLELILARHSHALAKTDSNLDNLEANITSLLDLGRETFNITAEHFMSTNNVSPEVEKRLDDLEEAETGEEEHHPVVENSLPENKRSKIFILVPILIIIMVFAAVVFFREGLLLALKNQISPAKPVAVETTSTPTPSPTVTPITVDRSKFKVRVLNGTPKTGAAGVLAGQLKEKGWQIDRTGNATSSAIPESFVRSKPGMGDAISVLIADVSDYQGSSSSSSLKSSDKADLEFVIGKK